MFEYGGLNYVLIKYVVILFAVLGVLYTVYLFAITWYEVKHQQRHDMFICDKHGMLPKESVVNFGTYLGTSYEACSICYNQRLRGKS